MEKPMWEFWKNIRPEEREDLYYSCLSTEFDHRTFNEITGLSLWIQAFACFAERYGELDLLARTVNFIESDFKAEGERDKLRDDMIEYEKSKDWITPILDAHKYDIKSYLARKKGEETY